MKFDAAADELQRREYARFAAAITPRPEQLRSMTAAMLRAEAAALWEALGHDIATAAGCRGARPCSGRPQVHHHVRQSGRALASQCERVAPAARPGCHQLRRTRLLYLGARLYRRGAALRQNRARSAARLRAVYSCR